MTLTETQIRDERLRLLREMFAMGQLALDDYERHVDTVLAGQQPRGLLIADPALYAWRAIL